MKSDHASPGWRLGDDDDAVSSLLLVGGTRTAISTAALPITSSSNQMDRMAMRRQASCSF
jgi:hypothetical protein